MDNSFKFSAVVAGAGISGATAAARLAAAGLRVLVLERVRFEGFQNPEPYYRDASIFCMTSAYEGLPMVLIEAASFGCVPVAFESFAAVRDIISAGENGCLVPAFDLDAYAETLARLMSDDALRERLAQIPEKFSPEKIGAQWEALFREIATQA